MTPQSHMQALITSRVLASGYIDCYISSKRIDITDIIPPLQRETTAGSVSTKKCKPALNAPIYIQRFHPGPSLDGLGGSQAMAKQQRSRNSEKMQIH